MIIGARVRPGPRAVILAGGKGTRLGPFTTILPKPLLPIGDRAILELLVEQLRLHGFTRLTLAVGYLSHLVEAVMGDGSAYGVSIDYHYESEPLGTAGALAGVPGLEEPFLMLNGDVITTLDFSEFLAVHVASDSALTIATQVRRAAVDFGVLELEEGNGRPCRTSTGTSRSQQRARGVDGRLRRRPGMLLHLVKPGAYLDFPDLVLKALSAGERVCSSIATTGSGSTSDAMRTTSGRSPPTRTSRPSSGLPRLPTSPPPAKYESQSSHPAHQPVRAGSPRDGMEFRPHALAREWQAEGHDVLIVAGSPSHVRGAQPRARAPGQPRGRRRGRVRMAEAASLRRQRRSPRGQRRRLRELSAGRAVQRPRGRLPARRGDRVLDAPARHLRRPRRCAPQRRPPSSLRCTTCGR